MYPSIVELCLQTNIFAFFLVLCAQDLELIRLQGRLDVGGVWRVSAGVEGGDSVGATHKVATATLWGMCALLWGALQWCEDYQQRRRTAKTVS